MHEQAEAASGSAGGASSVHDSGSAELFRDSFQSLLRLARTEASLALTCIPRLIAVGLARILMLCLGVFGVCLGGALGLYSYSGSILVGMAAFVLPMAAIIMLLGRYQNALNRELTLPATRAEIEAYTELFKEACGEKATVERGTEAAEHGLAGQA